MLEGIRTTTLPIPLLENPRVRPILKKGLVALFERSVDPKDIPTKVFTGILFGIAIRRLPPQIRAAVTVYEVAHAVTSFLSPPRGK